MKIKNAILLVFLIFSFTNIFSQNNLETPTLSPDSNKTNNMLSLPTGGEGGGNSTGSTLLEQENKEEKRSNPLEIETLSTPAPVPSENMKTEGSMEEVEEAPVKSEPVPGAEILIEQEPNDYKNQGNSPNSNHKNKEKKKNKKPNK